MLSLSLLAALSVMSSFAAAEPITVPGSVDQFLSNNCFDCHGNGASEGGLAIDEMLRDLHEEPTLAKWVRLYDRVKTGEMPPADYDAPAANERATFLKQLASPMSAAHAQHKGTVLRRLNRREFENTLNDVFGTNADLVDLLPEDNRSGEFDTVGESLGISMVHLERYLEAARLVLDEAIAKTSERPEPRTVHASYKGTREAEKFVGSRWMELSDGAIVRFSGGGYPTGMMRSATIPKRGRYRVRIEGYAFQSSKPITFSVGAMTFQKGAENPTFGYFSFPPGQPGGRPSSIEFEAWIDERYMIQIEPYGISDANRYKRKSIEGYEGPGLAILNVSLDGPLVDSFPTRGHRLLFDGMSRTEVPPRNPRDRQRNNYRAKFDVNVRDEKAAISRSLSRVAEALYRRPVDDDDIAPFAAHYWLQRDEGADIDTALRSAVTGLICSPKFLYFQEPEKSLDDYAVAARLSYLLHRSRPDEKLMSDAARNRLSGERSTLASHANRLIADERFDRFVEDFCASWLDLREIDFTIPDRQLYPEFDNYLRWSMPRETEAFVREMIVANHPIRDFVSPNFAMINSRLAELYELPVVDGAEIRKVSLEPKHHRGGLLTQASLLKVTANGTNTSPVVRGAWVMDRLLGDPPPPPPPGVPGVEPDIRGATTLRELLDKHRDQVNCNACHRKIDPPGFALESFNAIGGFRNRYRSLGSGDRVDIQIGGQRVRYKHGQPVDSSGVTPAGQTFADFAQFQKLIADQEDVLARTFVEKLLTFATGREMGFSDRPEIEQIVSSSAREGYRAGDLLRAAIASDIFQSK